MIRRRSTMDHSERIKQNKLVEMYAILDLCLQLPSEDRITLRNQVKAGDEQLMERLNQCKKDKNYHQLQIYLRKFVQKLKQNDKYGLGLQIPKHPRGRTPQTLKSMKNPTDSSYHNSRQNSFQSSPSAKKTVKLSLTKDQNNEIIQTQVYAEPPRREFTPREIKVQIRPLQVHAPKNQQIVAPSLSIKNLLKSKINDRISKHPVSNDSHSDPNKENIQAQLKQNALQNRTKLPLALNNKNPEIGYKKQKYEEMKYGQFYKRIKKVIEQAS